MQYDRPAAEAYEAARSMPLEALTAWRTVLAPYLTGSNQRPVLDLGSGTGLFSHALAVWFDRAVIGVEPSEEMRRQAELHRSHPRITYLAGHGLVSAIGSDALVIKLNRGYPGEERVLFVGEQTRLEPNRSSLTSFQLGDLLYFTGTSEVADPHAREVWAILISTGPP